MKFLITGGQGFLGAYVVRNLIRRKIPCTLFDVNKDDHILQQVLTGTEIKQLERITGDVSQFDSVYAAINSSKPSHIIHLAALQVPSCRTNPLRGAQVNVVGHINIFESVKKLYEHNPIPIVYASSAAVAGFSTDYSESIEDNTPHVPRTHYGVFKLANEGNSRIYWQDHKIKSIGLRPHTIYGVGRELGITSGPTKAIKATILNKKFVIPFSGNTSFLYIEDAADLFVRCSLVEFEGAHALNVRGVITSSEDFVQMLHKEMPESKQLVSIAQGAAVLPLAYDFKQKGLEALLKEVKYTPLLEGIRKTAEQFKYLHKQNMLSDKDLSQ